jgi:SAM-dependent methyltransferase
LHPDDVASVHQDDRIMGNLGNTTALFALFADPTRVRLMSLLWSEEHTVAELTRITGLPQSRVSTHLGRLRDAGLLHDRPEGASTFYRAHREHMPDAARETWELVMRRLDDAIMREDAQHSRAIVRARTEGRWPDMVAGRMEHHYSPGRTWEATARGILGLLRLGDVLDVGSGDGVITELLAPRTRTITCLDRSERVIEAARLRLARCDNAHFVLGDMHAMPLPDGAFDQILLFNVLTYAPEPTRVLAEAHRVLRPGGALALVTLDEHNHPDVSAIYQHVNHGFSPATIGRMLEAAGFSLDSCELSSRERRKPFFGVVSAFASRPAAVEAYAS